MIISNMKAILAINPNAECSLSGDDISTLTWNEGTTPISVEDIEAKRSELEAKENNKATLKASAKAKLIAGEALTEAEADTIVL